jgi:peptide deformylase
MNPYTYTFDPKDIRLIPGNDKRLFAEAETFDFDNPPIDPFELQNAVLFYMIRVGHLFLTGNQIGFPYKVIFMVGNPNLVFYNTKIVNYSQTSVKYKEAIPNLPGLVVQNSRSFRVRARYQTASGGLETKSFDGITSQLLQIGVDISSGLPYYNRSNHFHREKAKKFIRKLEHT